MRAMFVVLVALLSTASCSPPPRSDEQLSPSAYLNWKDRLKAVAINHGLFEVGLPCVREVVEGGAPVIGSKPTDQCYRMTPPRRWRGLWRYGFEAPQFCESPARECDLSSPGMYVSLEFAKGLPGLSETPPGGLYEMDFVGRETLVAEPHLRRPSKQIIVDRLIAIKEIEPPTMGPIPERFADAYRKECAGVQLCMPNSLVDKTN